jgi:integrase
MKGSTFKRCPCGTVRDAQGNRINCPKKHGTWYYAHELPPGQDGRRRQSRVGGFATEREAREALTEVLSQIQRGTYRFRTKQTVAEYLHRWLDGKADLRATTRRSYTETIRLYLDPGIGHIQLIDLRPEDVEALFEAMRQVGRPEAEKKPSPTLRRLLKARQHQASKPMSDARIKRVHATLMSALNTAVKRQLISDNPAKHVEVRQGRRPKAVVWTDEQIESWKRTGIRPAVAVWTAKQTGQFLDAASSERLYPLFHVIAYRGLRRGEAVGLRWEDIDLDRAQLRVRQQIVQLGWQTQIGEPKSAHGARPVSLDANTVRVLREWRDEQQRERQAMGEAWQNTGFVFTDIDGTGLHPDIATDTFQRIARGAGLPPIRLHDYADVFVMPTLAGRSW